MWNVFGHFDSPFPFVDDIRLINPAPPGPPSPTSITSFHVNYGCPIDYCVGWKLTPLGVPCNKSEEYL